MKPASLRRNTGSVSDIRTNRHTDTLAEAAEGIRQPSSCVLAPHCCCCLVYGADSDSATGIDELIFFGLFVCLSAGCRKFLLPVSLSHWMRQPNDGFNRSLGMSPRERKRNLNRIVCNRQTNKQHTNENMLGGIVQTRDCTVARSLLDCQRNRRGWESASPPTTTKNLAQQHVAQKTLATPKSLYNKNNISQLFLSRIFFFLSRKTTFFKNPWKIHFSKDFNFYFRDFQSCQEPSHDESRQK